MRISATGNRSPPSDAGFTLVEALSTLLIVALLAGAVMLITPGPERKSKEAAERLAAHIVMAGEESILVNRAMALIVTGEGYGFARLEANGWLRIDDGSPLAFRSWPPNIEVKVASGDATRVRKAHVARFDPLGGATPAKLEISGGGAWWSVEIDAEGKVHVARTK